MGWWRTYRIFIVFGVVTVGFLIANEIYNARTRERFAAHRLRHACTSAGVSRSGGSIAFVCDDGSTWTVVTTNGN